MIRLWLWASVPALVVCFVLVFLVIGLPKNDYAALAQVVAPPGCAPPCTMGLRPGETTRAEAIAVLEAHPWVGTFTTVGGSSMSWTWSGLQPPFLSAEGEIRLSNDVISEVTMLAQAPLYAHQAVLGPPQFRQYFYTGTSVAGIKTATLRQYYFDGQLELTSTVGCPIASFDLFAGPVKLIWSAPGQGRARNVGRVSPMQLCTELS